MQYAYWALITAVHIFQEILLYVLSSSCPLGLYCVRTIFKLLRDVTSKSKYV